MRRLSLAIALLLIAPLACAQVYKWTDAHGTVHYSQTPPPTGTKYSRVNIEDSGAPMAASNVSSETEGPSDQSPPPSGNLPVADTPANRAKLCNSLRNNLNLLKSTRPVVMNTGGKRQLINAEQRKQQLDDANAQYQRYCSN
ncbi:DUF4124 domain-containing protein [Dyella sp. A6]|uniref:DUF4124 domain-containing protein n=1 Tax=Dyella aluminiiresistens TaxID=3069105 RepID=UPI002E75E148|nr:DUF4124 domain-containing protein [Dyella sp. A6]